MKPIRSRRRSLRFDGNAVTLSIATKTWAVVPDDQRNQFPLSKITSIRHTPATAWKPGKIEFVVPGGPSAIVDNVPMFADKLAGNTFQYDYGKRDEVAVFLAAVEKARGTT
ncbi:hypothetical protein Amsp01_066310 [Amycolatopsis sp. NBRC 101858]|uniref:hypothetical protein n=1 Tax=Amycolatopsis sp. NBRC 101858 TaxID=3032200 RepID=UPI0024A0AB38|nr:hypothetical protein [Amycolatopsis sp. NBRC 101858]GLY40608.1 hypothetical protein Amsp01_066310 [Amycolatopsis sp. NBRC 101858]